MVDTRDLKSLARKGVWVQVPPGVPKTRKAMNAEIAQLVEHDLAKVGVASSSLVFRSKANKIKQLSPPSKARGVFCYTESSLSVAEEF